MGRETHQLNHKSPATEVTFRVDEILEVSGRVADTGSSLEAVLLRGSNYKHRSSHMKVSMDTFLYKKWDVKISMDTFHVH